MAPQQKKLHRKKCAGVNDPFLAQNGCHNGNNKVSCIGIDQRGFLYTIQFQHLAQKADHHDQHQMQQHCRSQCQQQTVQNLGLILHLKRRDDHTWHDQIQ